MTKTYDPKCEDLARDFLADNPDLDMEKLAPLLAAHIQETIEDFIAGETDESGRDFETALGKMFEVARP